MFKDEALEAAARDGDPARRVAGAARAVHHARARVGHGRRGRRRPLHRRPAEGARRAGDAAHAGAVHQHPVARRACRSPAPTAAADRCTRGRRPWPAPPATRAVEGEICYVPSKYAGGTASLFDLPDAARGGGGDASGARPHRAHRGLLDAGLGRRVRAARRHRADLHPPRQERARRHLHVDLGRAHAESLGRKPAVPVVCINHPDGEALIADVQRGAVRASIKTWLREGWMRCLLPVVEIRGQDDPDEFLLVHGHYDSWYEGIGDNATGDAALLELARVLWGLRDRLKRTVRIAWWPGHSTGRYAGSTLVRRHLRRRDRRALHRAARHRLAGLRGRHGLRRSDVDGRGRRAVPLVDPGRARRALGARAAAARRRLLVQPDRADRPLHAALEHPDRGAQAPRLLRRRRLRRQHRRGTRRTT